MSLPLEPIVQRHVELCELEAYRRKVGQPKLALPAESSVALEEFHDGRPWLAERLRPRGAG